MFSKKQIVRSQRGAMFGLDARVALAIFGGLSVIAGAAVFSSVRETNVTSLLAEFDNISKGYINFTFDTGVDVPMGAGATLGFQNLFTDANGTLSWQGPYITRSTTDHPVFGVYELEEARIALGTAESTWLPGSETACTGAGGEVCGAWLTLTQVPCEIAGNLDTRIDGSISGNSGNFRFDNTCVAGDTPTVAYLLSRTMATN